MKGYCIHANCQQKTYSGTDRLCKYHREEYVNNGKPGHWTCTWCTEYADKEFQNKDQEQRISADI